MAFVTLTGTVVDPFGQPYAYGRISASFLPAAGVYHTYGGNAIQPGTQYHASLDSNGAFSLSVPKTSDIFPLGSKWTLRVCNNDGTESFSIDYTANATADISTTLNAAAAALAVEVDAGLLTRNVRVFNGSNTTRATVRAEVDALVAHASVAIGSVYFSSAGKIYLKVADAVADTDWQRVTTSAVD